MQDSYEIFLTVWKGDLTDFKKHIGHYDINCRNENGSSLLQYAISTKHEELAEEISKRAINLNIQDNKGQTCLHYLGVYPNMKLAKVILQNGANVNLRDSYGNIPLWTAVFYAKGKYDYVDLLMQYKSNPLSVNKAGRSPLDFANQIKDIDLVKILASNQ
jgi:uncharacterized protein